HRAVGAHGHDPVDARVRLQPGRHGVLDPDRVAGRGGQRLHDAAGFGQALGEPVATGVEGGVTDLVVDADGVLHAQLAQALATGETGDRLVRADVGQD